MSTYCPPQVETRTYVLFYLVQSAISRRPGSDIRTTTDHHSKNASYSCSRGRRARYRPRRLRFEPVRRLVDVRPPWPDVLEEDRTRLAIVVEENSKARSAEMADREVR